MGLLDALTDRRFWSEVGNNVSDFGQSASNAVASNVTAPVDGIAWLLRKAGVQVPEAPIGGSDWAKNAGLLRDVQQSPSSIAGETLGAIAPMLLAAKAPQVARGLLQGADNLMAPRTLNPETGAIVWHGSPHKFDKFDASKIGTGEGNQAYGRGLYLGESQETGKYYQQLAINELKADPYDASIINRFMGRSADPSGIRAESLAANSLAESVSDPFVYNPVNAMKKLRDKARESRVPDPIMEMLGIEPNTKKVDYDQARKYIREFYDKTGGAGDVSYLYKVDLPDEHIAKMLDWDKPLSAQPPEVQKALASIANGKMTGEQAWKAAIRESGNPLSSIAKKTGQIFSTPQDAADNLQRLGIPGIRYLDGGSRGTGTGTSNFVVFPGNEGLLQILERNGQAMNKAPQVARGLLQGADNLMAPTALRKEAGNVFVYPQDAALATAQRNAALPVSEGGLGLHAENTAMERAKALGFSDDVFHGTNADIRAFDPSMADSRRKTGTPNGAVVVSSNPTTAATYAGEKTNGLGEIVSYADDGNVLPLMLSKGKNMAVNAGGENWNRIFAKKYPDAETTNDLAEIALSKGKDSATIKRVLDNATWAKKNGIDSRIGDSTFVFNPANIRSRFAAFDPMRRNEADLLGRADPELLGLMSAGLLGYGGYNALNKQ